MGSRRKALRSIAVIIAVIAATVLCFALIGCAEKTDNGTAEINKITGITVEDTSAEFDGERHGIKIEGTVDGDEIYYSSDGKAWQTEEIEYIGKGEYKIYYRIVREGFEEYIGEATLYIKTKILTGVTARDAVIRFDGEKHGIEIDGLLPEDKVYYSTDGENFKETIEIKEIGEYTVYYRVVRGYAEYADSVKITVKENVTGTYLSGKGIIKITEENEEDYGIVNGKITQNGVIYEKLNADERAYRINGETYIKAKEECEITVSFEQGKATVKADGVKVKEYEDVNYCESINGIKLERKTENSDVTAKVRHSEEVTEIEIVISKRRENSIGEIRQRKKYTGKAQTVDVEDGWIITGELPKYTEVGEYTFTVYITEDGFLPEKVGIVFEIYKQDDGTYYSIETNGLVEIKDGKVTLNGEEVTEEVESTENGITVNNIEYRKQGTNEKLCKMIIGDKTYIRVLDGYEYYITTEGADGKTTVTITDEDGNIILTDEVNSVSVTVGFNDKPLVPISDTDYIFTRTDFDAFPVSVLTVG